MKHHNGRAVKAGSEWGTAFRRPRGVTNNKTETAAGTLAAKVDDLGGKSIPSAPINPLLCLIVQMAGQEFVINVDQSVQVSTALLSGCGAPARSFLLQEEPFYGLISLFSIHTLLGLKCVLQGLLYFFFFMKGNLCCFLGFLYFGCYSRLVEAPLGSAWTQRFLSINEPNVSKL